MQQRSPGQINRRRFLGSALALFVAPSGGNAQPSVAPVGRVRPGEAGWPGDADWSELNHATSGRLARVAPVNFDNPNDRKLLTNPFFLRDTPGLTQSSGWFGAWRSQPSRYVVAAETAADVAAAVGFAKQHNLRLVVRGTGHSYFGASSAPDSLLLWTRKLDAIAVHDAFVPQGSSAPVVPAITVGAGCIWLHACQAAAKANRYVQGGGCTTVGVAGLVLGGGFGSLSKAYGTAASSLLEAEIATADGQIRTVNQAREPELFWALKGGGGGSFGIVTSLTLATHPLPSSIGALNVTWRARSDQAFRKLLAHFISLYATDLSNPHWGEQVRLHPDNRLQFRMVFQGLSKDQAVQAFSPLFEFVKENPDDYEAQETLDVAAVPGRYFWNGWLYRLFARSAVNFDERASASWTDYWWKGDSSQVGAFWHAYTSAWLPGSLLSEQNQPKLLDALFKASRQWPVSLHFNKGLFGAPEKVIARGKTTSTHPDAFEAFALAIIAAVGPSTFAGGAAPDPALAKAQAAGVSAAMTALRGACPNTGAYVNECDYFQPDWQNALWGSNYRALLEVKRRYDPDGLFYVHHGVGSEGWNDDGFSRLRLDTPDDIGKK